jgi:hypothetical protein
VVGCLGLVSAKVLSPGRLAQSEEHHLHTVGVKGSRPLSPTVKPLLSGGFLCFGDEFTRSRCTPGAQEQTAQANTRHHFGAYNGHRIRPELVAVRRGNAAVGVALDQCSHVVLSIAWGAADVVASRICEPAGCSSLSVFIAEQGPLQERLSYR